MDALGPAPPGGDRDRGYILVAVSVTTFAFVALSGALRLITRAFIIRQLGWDDFCISLALLLSIVSTAFNVKQIHEGGGRHIYYLSPPHAIEARKWVDLAELFVFIITCLTKVSFCLFLMRIPNSKRVIYFLWLLIVALIVVNASCAIVYILQCRPMAALWNPTIEARCWSSNLYLIWGYIQGVFSVVTDFICSGLPIVVLWNVKISSRKKFGICALMALGLFATACCMVRIALFRVVLDPYDPTWSIVTIEIWAILEENLGLIAVNVPVMVPLYRLLREKVPSGYSLMRSYLRKSSSGGASVSQHSSRNRAFQRMKDANQNDAPMDMEPLPGITKTVDTSVDIV
ncbi:hypothetical protein MMC14_005029 [Varicellaria rhodocarpa]|nr:hypothetical protein [Varicellaria rhodocarpa]